jgi:catechol 2,3-dioxygenase-like lactoylglutathione lyase family enzyme
MVNTASPIRLPTAEPILFVADFAASCAFFREKLGFAVVFDYGDPPFYGQVRRDGAALNLRHVDAPVIDAARRHREEMLSAAFPLGTEADLRRLDAEFRAAGVSFHSPLTRQLWGALTFIVADPDGNLLLFAAPTD